MEGGRDDEKISSWILWYCLRWHRIFCTAFCLELECYVNIHNNAFDYQAIGSALPVAFIFCVSLSKF